MVKAYLRYEPVATLGVISSTAAVAYSTDGSQIVTAALESVKIWNGRSGELVRFSRARFPLPYSSPRFSKAAIQPSLGVVSGLYRIQCKSARLWRDARRM